MEDLGQVNHSFLTSFTGHVIFDDSLRKGNESWSLRKMHSFDFPRTRNKLFSVQASGPLYN